MVLPTITNSSKLSGATQVMINLSNNNSGGKRVSVNKLMTFADLGIEAETTANAAPTGDSLNAQIAQINASGMEAVAKAEAIQNALAEYKAAVSAAASAGGQANLADRVILKVVQYLEEKEGFVTSDQGADKPVIKPSELQATVVQTQSGDLLFNVVGTSVWG